MLQALAERGLIYKTRHGHFAFTVPMSESMIRKRLRDASTIAESWATDETSARPKAKRWTWFR